MVNPYKMIKIKNWQSHNKYHSFNFIKASFASTSTCKTGLYKILLLNYLIVLSICVCIQVVITVIPLLSFYERNRCECSWAITRRYWPPMWSITDIIKFDCLDLSSYSWRLTSRIDIITQIGSISRTIVRCT